MDNKKYKILILEDVPADGELIINELRQGGLMFESERVDKRQDFLDALNTFKPDLVLSDYNLPQFDGLSALKIVKEQYPDTPFIFISGVMGDELAVETLKKGATDYVLKDKLIKLMPAVKRAFREAETDTKLKEKVSELDNLINSTVKRELKMVELKKTISELKEHMAERAEITKE
jgi:two-component system sensor kinase